MKHLEYKGYTGSIEYSKTDHILYGKVLGIQSLISFEGETGEALELDFQEAIESYFADCKAEGRVPEKPFKGSFNVRVPIEVHKRLALKAMESQVSLNALVNQYLIQMISPFELER